jgi:cobalt-zinc-cadmium efflux system membrane fusion protein
VKATALNADETGTISYVGPLLGEQTRSAKARATLKNPDQRWRPGLFVTVEVVQAEAKVPVAVSADAIQTLGDSPVVFLRSAEMFEARQVELGRSDGNHVEIIKGLAAGDRYAATNSFVLKAELGKAGTSHAH